MPSFPQRPQVPDLINPFRPEMDADRMRRALDLPVERLGPAIYAVHGDGETYHVELHYYFSCDCADFSYRDGTICKHLLAALVTHGDPAAVALAAEVVQPTTWPIRRLA